MDTLTPEERSERMSRVRNKDTKPELRVRRLVFSLGYRFRLHQAKLPGRPDLTFPGRRRAIEVRGCYWHRHPDPACPLARLPKSKLEFWLPKLQANRERDVRNEEKLRDLGWSLLVVWECQLRDEENLRATIRAFLGAPSVSPARYS